MHRIKSAKALPNWELEVVFTDGTAGTVSIKDRLFGEMFEPLKDPAFFRQASVDEFGVVCWPNGADLSPDALYEKVKAHVPVG